MQAFLEALLQLVAAGVLVLGGYAIQRLSAWLKLREDSEVRAYLNDALNRAVDLAMTEARSRIAPRIAPLGPVPDELVAKAVAYARDRVPDALARFQIDDVSLQDMLRSRISSRALNALGHAAG
ncbi:MAG: hypothetical protein K5Q68_14975 [Roseococcus sp.]|nr:hypothetical protein [Roseococcus sp.]